MIAKAEGSLEKIDYLYRVTTDNGDKELCKFCLSFDNICVEIDKDVPPPLLTVA